MTNHAALRLLKREGITRFKDLIDELHQNPELEIDLSWIHEDPWSLSLGGDQTIEETAFDQKLEIAQYLLPIIRDLDIENKYFDQGLWAWLSAFYFDSVCPVNEQGTRKPGKAHRHIPPSDRYWRTVYRHLLAGPVRLYDMHGDEIHFLLRSNLSVHGDFMEQLASRQEIASSIGILAAAEVLYWDPDTNEPKVGARSTDRAPGTLRRYVDVLQQLMLTYDLYSMSGEEILKILPYGEFSSWIPEDYAKALSPA